MADRDEQTALFQLPILRLSDSLVGAELPAVIYHDGFGSRSVLTSHFFEFANNLHTAYHLNQVNNTQVQMLIIHEQFFRRKSGVCVPEHTYFERHSIFSRKHLNAISLPLLPLPTHTRLMLSCIQPH